MSVIVNQTFCKWFVRHKLKDLSRSCHLKVRDCLDDIASPGEQYIDESSFRHADLNVKLADPSTTRCKPDVEDLRWGQTFTDHMFKCFYHKRLGGWQKPVITPFENITLHPAAKVLHYAVELFEGMKAYRGKDGRIRIFRPDLNMVRMNLSAKSAGLPTFDGPEFIKCLNRLIQVEQEWVPHSEGSSLYIRPTLIGIDGTLGVSASESALLFTILSPVGNYFAGKSEDVSLLADPSYTRAWPGGCGDRKMGSNYGPTIRVQNHAFQKGREQVLWLYGEDDQVTEAGTMNIFMLYINENGEKVLATPPLNGLILPGITRHSIIQLSHEWNEFKVEERPIPMMNIIELQRSDRLLELFGSGTACIVSPISSVEYLGEILEIPTIQQRDPIYKRIRNQLEAIQYGVIEHPWAKLIDE